MALTLTDLKEKKKTYCKSDDKHKEQQKDKHEDVKKRLQKSQNVGREGKKK